MIDLYSDDFPAHGSPAGFDAGCNTRQKCVNFASDDLMTCTEAASAHRTDYNLGKQPKSEPIARSKPMVPAPTPKNPGTAALQKYTEEQRKAAPVPAPAPQAQAAAPATDAPTRTRGPYLPRNLTFDDERFPHGTVKGYQRGCKTEYDCNKNRDHDTTTGTCVAAHLATLKGRKTAGGEGSQAAAPEQAQVSPGRETAAPSTSRDGGEPGQAEPKPSLDVHTEPSPPAPIATALAQNLTDALADAGLDVDVFDSLPDNDTRITELEQELAEARTELANAEEAGRRDATTIRRLENINAELNATITRLGAELTAARDANASLLERLQQATGGGIATIPTPQPLTAPLPPAEDLGVTIEPTPSHGVRISLTAGNHESLHINLALAASDRPGLGDLAIAVGGSRDEQR